MFGFCETCQRYAKHEDSCTVCWQKVRFVDFNDPRECEKYLMNGLQPSMYKPALRAFREFLQVVEARRACELAMVAQIDMLEDR